MIESLLAKPPASLSRARAQAHNAVQHLTRLARANLEAQPDDSHSNLGWSKDLGALTTHPLGGNLVGLQLSTLTLILVRSGETLAQLPLDGLTPSAASQWLDAQAQKAGLNPGSQVEIPYALPEDAAGVSVYDLAGFEAENSTLSAWFELAEQTLTGAKQRLASYRPGPSAVRCWPHHFDIATYAALESGDPETARGIGIGMSPGDEAYNQPYFYINPWPHIDAEGLLDAPPPGHWHTEGFAGLIATGAELVSTREPQAAADAFVQASIDVALAAQGWS